MADLRYNAPKGTHDIGPSGKDRTDWADDISKWHWLEGIFHDLAERYGYEELRTPVFEQTDLFKRAVGEGTDIVNKEMYEFQTRPDKNGKSDKLTLRPEGTAPALRAYVENRIYIERPVAKIYYMSSIFRYERPANGRYRQHHQIGVEVLGAPGPDIDAEVISLAMDFFRRLGVTNLCLKLNSVGTKESRVAYVEALKQFAEPLLVDMSEDNKRRFRENPLRMLDSKDERDKALLTKAPLLTDYLDSESRTHFYKLQQYLTDLEIDFDIDPRLVRGFDYYTRTAFEIQSPDVGAQSALAGGGRYDSLVEELGGPATPGIGFGLGIERALMALQAAHVPVPKAQTPLAFLCPLGEEARNRCVSILAHMRASGIQADMDYTGRRLRAMLEQADRLGSRYAIIIGDDELERGVAQVRDQMTDDKKQSTVPIADLSYFVTY